MQKRDLWKGKAMLRWLYWLHWGKRVHFQFTLEFQVLYSGFQVSKRGQKYLDRLNSYQFGSNCGAKLTVQTIKVVRILSQPLEDFCVLRNVLRVMHRWYVYKELLFFQHECFLLRHTRPKMANFIAWLMAEIGNLAPARKTRNFHFESTSRARECQPWQPAMFAKVDPIVRTFDVRVAFIKSWNER